MKKKRSQSINSRRKPKLVLERILDYSGISAIISKCKRFDDKGYRKFPTIVLWFLGIYFAAFGIASNRYENSSQRIENRINALTSQIATSDEIAFRNIIAQIPDIQKMKSPVQPNWNPLVIGYSFLSNEYNKDTVKWLKEIIEIWKSKLSKAKLSKVDLSGVDLTFADLFAADLTIAKLNGTDLTGANLREADLTEAELRDADLFAADLIEAFLVKADLTGANLRGGDLTGIDLRESNLTGANISGANLSGADLTGANLKRANFLNSKDTKDAIFASDSSLNADLMNLLPNGILTDKIWSQWKATYKKHKVAYPKDWD